MTMGMSCVAFFAACAARGLYCDDYIDAAADKLRRQCWEAAVLAFRRSQLDLDVLSLSVAKLAEGLPKGSQRLGATNEKKTNSPDTIDLLRSPRDRPRRPAAKQRDELAALQLTELHPLPPKHGATG
jgi:hypothetical protein